MDDVPAPIQVTVEVAIDDYEALLERSYAHQGVVRRMRLLGALLAMFIAAATLAPATLQGYPVGVYQVLFVVAAMAVLAIGWWSGALMRRASVRHLANSEHVENLTGRVRLVLDPAGISSHTRTASTWHSWEVVSRIDETETHVFVTVGAHRAFIFPRRAYESTLPWPELAGSIRTMRRDAKNYFPKCPQCGFDLSNLPIHGCPECGWERNAFVAAA